MKFLFEEIQDEEISEQKGMISGVFDSMEVYEQFSVVWQNLDFEPDVEADRDNLVEEYVTIMSENPTFTIVESEKQLSKILDHVVYYQTVTVSDTHGGSLEVTYATWYCNFDSRAYRIIFEINYCARALFKNR
jgi:hypothetical protein